MDASLGAILGPAGPASRSLGPWALCAFVGAPFSELSGAVEPPSAPLASLSPHGLLLTSQPLPGGTYSQPA